jgi:predicted NodU family carbamoyl transferase
MWSRGKSPRHDRRREEALFGIEKLNVPRSDIPAVTHVDYSARIQTVHERDQSTVSRTAFGLCQENQAARCW